MKTLLLTFIIVMIFSRHLFAQKGSDQSSMTPAIVVSEKRSEWVVRGEYATVSVDKTNFQVSVKTPQTTWQMAPAADDDLVLVSENARHVLSFAAAESKIIESYHTGFSTGLKIELSQFSGKRSGIDLVVQLFITLERETNELVFQVVAIEGESVLQECQWPKHFEPDCYDHTVIPFMQGILLPKEWPERVKLYNTMSYGRGLYMPWWGHQQGDAAAILILETAVDAGAVFSHPENGPTLISPKWVHSLGSFQYPRKTRLCFFDYGNYVDLAKKYREYVQEHNHFKSLDEKIAKTAAVAHLIGSPILHTSILNHFVESSSFYDPNNPARNHRLTTFDDRAKQIEQLKQRGIDQLYIHLDGWGYRGYDNLHPDYLPPSPEAGGWDGMKRFVDTCKALGYKIALHDQYRDYYHDAVSYDERHTLMRENSRRHFGTTWAGGAQSVLCPSLAPGFVEMNHSALQDHGIQVDGSYLDVFAVHIPEECYDPEHPVSRAECLAYRAHSFNIIKHLEGITSSEEPVDWAIPYLDLVHHGPYALVPDPGSGPAVGIPIPLFNLVYHDAIILPWSITQDKGGWGIPDDDSGFLHGLLNAGIPYISINPTEQELKKVRLLSDLHGRVGKLEMTNHEFLDSGYRKQRTTFADGTWVTVDFEKDSFVVEP